MGMASTPTWLDAGNCPRTASMRVHPRAAFRFVFSVWLLAVLSPVYAAELPGTVVKVHDGDTVTVLDAGKTQHKIRLAGIDAPELSQAFGRVSRQHLTDQVAGRTVVIEWSKRDRYKRLVGKVLLNGHDINILNRINKACLVSALHIGADPYNSRGSDNLSGAFRYREGSTGRTPSATR